MKNIVVVGTQWGDEGKGKLVDLLAPSFDVVARYQGGHNAGHTVWIGDRKYILRLLPSGILDDDCLCVIGNGVVVDPGALLGEIEELESAGIVVRGRLFISDRAHMILPFYREIERLSEDQLGDARVGTTMRGIGPAYERKAARLGVRIGDLRNLDVLRAKLGTALATTDRNVGAVASVDGLLATCREHGARLESYICDTGRLLNEFVDSGKTVLLEGAQGTMLDVDHGTYPYVTSSNSTAGGACTGTGLGPTRISGVIGIAKAYITRVGTGPLPTELNDEFGRYLQEKGQEFGAVTGRPRRTGWFDVPVLRYAATVNGVDSIALTKLDVLDELETIRVCVAYSLDGELLDTIPSMLEEYERVQPVYESLPGWRSSTRGICSFEDLPKQARDYISALEDLTRVEVGLISTGPERSETIIRKGGRIEEWR